MEIKKTFSALYELDMIVKDKGGKAWTGIESFPASDREEGQFF
ncbi:MAG: hypothetical protein RDU59_03090 [Thermodesulfobacteriota bacterium]|nr:hypothetical protein [Thermodesulfobacteriota bacterium]